MTRSRRATRAALPDLRRLLSGLFAGRIVLALVTVVAGSLTWTERPDVAFLTSAGVIIVLLITGYGIWRLAQKGPTPGRVFLVVQFLADVALVTALAWFLGPEGGTAPALFVLVIATYAVLMPFRIGVFMTLVASAVYVLLMWGSTGGTIALLLQVVVFVTVFAVVAILGQKLREAGAEQRSLETELRRVRLEADVILRNIHSGVLTVGADGRLAYANLAAERLLGMEATTEPGAPIMDLVRARAPGLWSALMGGLEHGQRVRRGEATVTSGGRQFPIGLSTTTFRQAPSEGQSVTAVFTDISDSKRIQELHLRAERLEAVAALSASLAHEIRNPLASIRSSVEQLARGAHAGEDERVLAALIMRESDRLSRLLSEFLDFSRVRATRAEPLDLHSVATAAVRLVRAHPDCRPTAELVVEGERTLVEGDEDLLHRSLVNLLLNAVQAAGDAPVRVTVTVEGLDGALGPADMPGGGPAVRLVVRDTGPGIPEEIRSSLFEPFVSRRQGGSGLGLAIVQRAVEAHRGLIFVESAPGGGTAFTIHLPATWAAEENA